MKKIHIILSVCEQLSCTVQNYNKIRGRWTMTTNLWRAQCSPRRPPWWSWWEGQGPSARPAAAWAAPRCLHNFCSCLVWNQTRVPTKFLASLCSRIFLPLLFPRPKPIQHLSDGLQLQAATGRSGPADPFLHPTETGVVRWSSAWEVSAGFGVGSSATPPGPFPWHLSNTETEK